MENVKELGYYKHSKNFTKTVKELGYDKKDVMKELLTNGNINETTSGYIVKCNDFEVKVINNILEDFVSLKKKKVATIVKSVNKKELGQYKHSTEFSQGIKDAGFDKKDVMYKLLNHGKLEVSTEGTVIKCNEFIVKISNNELVSFEPKFTKKPIKDKSINLNIGVVYLKGCERYSPTPHFLNRLKERFGVTGDDVVPFINRLKSSLIYKEGSQGQTRALYINVYSGIVVIVDHKTYELVTLYPTFDDYKADDVLANQLNDIEQLLFEDDETKQSLKAKTIINQSKPVLEDLLVNIQQFLITEDTMSVDTIKNLRNDLFKMMNHLDHI